MCWLFKRSKSTFALCSISTFHNANINKSFDNQIPPLHTLCQHGEIGIHD